MKMNKGFLGKKMTNQSVATMSVEDLESLINEIIDRKLNNINFQQQDNLEKTEIVRHIDNLRAEINAKYGEFPDSTDLFQEDRRR